MLHWRANMVIAQNVNRPDLVGEGVSALGPVCHARRDPDARGAGVVHRARAALAADPLAPGGRGRYPGYMHATHQPPIPWPSAIEETAAKEKGVRSNFLHNCG